MEKDRKGVSFLGVLLIVIGVLWVLKEVGWHIGLPAWDSVSHSFVNFLNIFQIGAWSVSWPVVVLIVGVLLLVGRRLVGTLLILLALFLFLPHFIIPGILIILFFPILIVVVGIILISKLF